MNPKAVAVALTFLLAATILGQESNPPKSNDAIRKLSKRERNQRAAKLGETHREFIRDVEPIMLPAELDLFLSLEKAEDRDSFVAEFWRRRDHMNRAHGGNFKEVYARRLEVAREQFRAIDSDRAKMFLLHGPPQEVVRPNCGRVIQPVEIWKYQEIPGFGQNVRILFYKPRHQGEFRLWNPVGGAAALSELTAAADPLASADESRRRGLASETPSSSPYAYISRIQIECPEGNEVMLAVTQMIQARVDLMKLFSPPELEDETVQKIMRSVVIANPNAPKLNAETSVRFPAKDGSRTDMQLTMLVPKSELAPASAGGVEVYTLDVAGEVLKDGQLWEKYRYRFDFPAANAGDKLPVVIDRLLRPYEYVSRVKITDANTGAEALVEQTVQVPEIFDIEPVAAPAVVPKAPVAVTAAAPEQVSPVLPRLRILPPSEEPASGLQKIEAQTGGEGIKAVEFWLDGKKIAVRRAPPFTLEVDFGEIPQTRRVRAIALDAQNKPLTGDELTVNAGTNPFRIRIVSPRFAPHLEGLTRVEMEVEIPEEDELQSVELYWNETRLATLYDEPFVQTIDIPKSDGPGYLRAVATLKDSAAPPLEDVVMINTPAYMEELNVHLVELPTTVLIDGKPSNSLTEKAFKILDDGKPVQIAKFEYVRDLPLSIGMAIDSSGSMQNRMAEAQKAGAQFFEKVLRKGDKAFVVAFDVQPRMMQKWSPKTADVHAALAKVRAEDRTALYDAIIFSLYNFQGVRGQKALVVISDGKDTASTFTYDQALEYARRTGVPIYGVGIGIRPSETDVRFKLDRICRETGGSTHYIEQARDLQRVYDDIQTELRSQYILGFYPSGDVKPGGKWREVTVQTSAGKVKTVKGYFP